MREPFHSPLRPLRSPRGFTLIELMIVVVVAGILAAVAIPSYQQYIMKSRRQDARVALSAMLQAQERYRSNQATYASDPVTLIGTAVSSKGYYNLSVKDLTPPVAFVSGYELHARPNGDPQTRDTDCADIFIRVSSGNLSYRDGNMTDTALVSPCWPQ
ncbi:type IV pilin protein [Paucibacter sp. R3-3]|uniref:Type IV pilin protein n=1 Tax=Roseateles agri TaxID=3098619 RepID=A0ABU5DHR7_9BURK|nr:type IV pilin protein [Paucibacter sp. R3-3]MDY0745840.1 type IV pilin protein [Paucibacter sp. R3-3]